MSADPIIPPVDGIELSAFCRELPDVEARIDSDYLSLRYSIDGRLLIEHTLFLPAPDDAPSRLVGRITDALAAAKRVTYPQRGRP